MVSMSASVILLPQVGADMPVGGQLAVSTSDAAGPYAQLGRKEQQLLPLRCPVRWSQTHSGEENSFCEGVRLLGQYPAEIVHAPLYLH